VTVLCGTGRYRLPHVGTKLAVDQAKSAGADLTEPLPSDEQHRGVHICRVKTPTRGPAGGAEPAWMRLFLRASAEARFCAGALAALYRLVSEPATAPEVIVALSSPPLLLALGLFARRMSGVRQIPLVYWVQDVYPELLFALGAFGTGRREFVDKWAAVGLSRLWRRLYRGVDAAVALDQAMAGRLIASGLLPERVHVIEHFADCREIAPRPAATNRLRAALGLKDAFVIGYAGNLGRGHDFTTVVEALRILGREDAPADAAALHFLFIGEGEKQPGLVAAVPESLRSRVHFLPPQARSELCEVYTAGDVGLITLCEGLSGLMVPSKLYAQLAAGRPVVYVGPPSGQVAELCAPPDSRDKIGESIRNGDAAGLVAAWLRLFRDSEYREKLGRRARELAETRYDRHLATARHAALLQGIASAAAVRTAGERPAGVATHGETPLS